MINGKRKMRLELLESMQTLTRAAFEQQPPVYPRSRAIGKAVVFEEIEEELTEEMNAGWASFTRIGLGALLDQTEQADLRSKRFFRRKHRSANSFYRQAGIRLSLVLHPIRSTDSPRPAAYNRTPSTHAHLEQAAYLY